MMNSSYIILLNNLRVNFRTVDSSKIEIEYTHGSWQSFIDCVIQDDQSFLTTAFTMRVLVQNKDNGIQSVDFPYPNHPVNDRNRSINYILEGLLPAANYSIRISFSASFPKKQLFTSKAIYLRTWGKHNFFLNKKKDSLK